MVAVILLQKSEGSGLSGSQAASMFGGALTGRAAGNFLTKLTAWLATIFFILSASLAYIVSRHDIASGAQSRVRAALSAPTDISAETEEPVFEPASETTEAKSAEQ